MYAFGCDIFLFFVFIFEGCADAGIHSQPETGCCRRELYGVYLSSQVMHGRCVCAVFGLCRRLTAVRLRVSREREEVIIDVAS